MADFSFYLFSLPDTSETGQRFFVVKVSTADAQGRPREKISQSEAANSKFSHFVAQSLKSNSNAKFVKEIGRNQFLKLETCVVADLSSGEVVYEVKENPV